MKQLKKNQIGKILTRWESMLLYITILVILFFSNLSPYFMDAQNLLNNTFNFIEKAIIVLPMMFIIISAEIDISVASIIALCSVLMGLASQAGADTLVIILVGLLTGLSAGFLNGIIITGIGIPAIAVTIGSMSLFRGIAFVILGDKAFTKYPESFAYFGQGYIGNTNIPFQLVFFIIFAVIFGIVLHKTTYGRKLYAIGNNPTAARFSGINVNRIKLINFTFIGLCCGIASVFLTSRIGSTRPNIANGWELEIITTVVLGGVSIMGGLGNLHGVIISIFLLGLMKFGMGLINIPGKVMNIVTGFLLILAIMLPGFIRQLQSNARLKKQKARL
jgi:rhamnose transport system permease protein